MRPITACTLALLLVCHHRLCPADGFHLPSTTSTCCINNRKTYTSNVAIRASVPSPQSQRPYKSKLLQSSTNDDSQSPPIGNEIPPIDPSTKSQIRSIARHLSTQTLETLLSKSNAISISDELFFSSKNSNSSSPLFDENSHQQYVKYWDKAITRLREERDRAPADLLGEELTNRILSSLRGDAKTPKRGSYDANTVRTFLESDAVNSLFARLLYDAIFEFTTKFDILGNAASSLPLLGPMRNQMIKESKRNMDRTLGPLLQQFLKGYTRTAVRQAADFAVGEENAAAFGRANAKLVGYLLKERSLADWIPENRVLEEWREEVWEYLVGSEGEKDGVSAAESDRKRVLHRSIDWTYELAGDKCVEDLGVDVEAVLDASPTLERELGEFWRRCRDASEGTSS